MLELDLRTLDHGPVAADGWLAPDDPALADLAFEVLDPVTVDGLVQATGDGAILWRGHLHGRVGGECRRCLEPVSQEVDDDVAVVFSTDPTLEDDPGVYLLEAGAAVLDLKPVVREELALRVSAFPLCREECKGLCAECGADLNAGACSCAAGSNH